MAKLIEFAGYAITILTLIGMIIAIIKNPFAHVKKIFKDIKILLDDIQKLRLINLIDFSTDLDNGEIKTEAQFRHILDDGRAYLDDGWNGYGKECYENIQEHYKKIKEKERT